MVNPGGGEFNFCVYGGLQYFVNLGLHAKFQNHWTTPSGGERLEKERERQKHYVKSDYFVLPGTKIICTAYLRV